MEDIHVSKIDGRQYEIARLVTYTERKDYDLVAILDENFDVVCTFHGWYDFSYVESQIEKHLGKDKFTIEAYDYTNNEYYREVYDTKEERLAGLEELLKRDDINLTESEMKEFLETGSYEYGYDYIRLL